MTLVNSENRAGTPIKVADYHILPIERVQHLQPPGKWGVLLWRRPSAVVIQHPSAPDEIIEIQDPTRQAQIFLLVFGLVVSIILYLLKSGSAERTNEDD